MLEADSAPLTGEDAPAPTPDAPEPQTPAGGAPEGQEEAPEAPAELEKPEPEPEKEPGRDTKAPPAWVQRRIDELTRARHESDRRAQALESELRALRQPAEGEEAQPERQGLTREDVRREAEQIVAQQRFDEACNGVFDKGKTEFPDFEAALSNFKLVGGLSPHVVEMAIEAGDAHRVLYELGRNPEEAERIMRMPPARAAVAIAKMAAAPKRPAAEISKAPPPVRPIGGTTRSDPDPEKMTTAEWMAWRAKTASA